jgi:hypothetical protein
VVPVDAVVSTASTATIPTGAVAVAQHQPRHAHDDKDPEPDDHRVSPPDAITLYR